MAQKVNPSANRAAESFKTAGTIAHAEGDGYIVGQNSPTQIVVQDADLLEGNMAEFSESSAGNSLSVTIGAGEAFIFGAWLAIDRDTTVDLDASTTGQEVFVGWDKDGADNVIIGKAGAFSTSVNNSDPKIKIWEYDTDSTGVTGVRDFRTIGRSVNVGDGTTTIGRNGALEVHDSRPSGGFSVDINDSLGVGGPLGDGDPNEIEVTADNTETMALSKVYDTGPNGRPQFRANADDTWAEMVMARVGTQSVTGDELGRLVWQSNTSGDTRNDAASVSVTMIEDQPTGNTAADARLDIDVPVKSFGEAGWPGLHESTRVGHGRYFGGVDAEWDNDTGVWRARRTYPTPHAGIGFVNHAPGDGTGVGNIAFAAAPETSNQGEIVEWREMTFNEDGVLSLKDGGVELTTVTTPPAPSSGWVLYTDAEDGRLKARDSSGNVTTLAT